MLTHGDPHGDPCHGYQVTRFASLSLSRLSETQQKALRRNGSLGGRGVLQPRGAGKDQCCFRTIVQDLVPPLRILFVTWVAGFVGISVVVHCYESTALAWA